MNRNRNRHAVTRAWGVVVVLLSLGCASPETEVDVPDGSDVVDDSAPDAATRREIIRVVQSVFDAIESGDEALLREVLDPDAKLLSVRVPGEGSPVIRPSSIDDMARTITSSDVPLVERMWSPEVRVSGPLASVWAPYDFYRDGEFSHCGVDAIHLMHDGESWRITSLTWNALQPPACKLHPDGLPG